MSDAPQAAQPTPGNIERTDGQDVWGDAPTPRLFISHYHTQRLLAGALKIELARYGIVSFVAHDDIEPARAWEDHIIRALQTCDALLVLVTQDCRQSHWIDQEVGWALGRLVPVASVAVDRAPYGFVGRYQAIPGGDRSAEEISDDVFQVLLSDARTAATVIDAVVFEFENARSWDDAKWKFQRLNRIPALTGEQLRRIENAYFANEELNQAFYVRGRIEAFLRRHWESHGASDYEMIRDRP